MISQSAVLEKIYGSEASSTSALLAGASASVISSSFDPLASCAAFSASAALRASASAAALAALSASSLAWIAWRSASTFSKWRCVMGPARALSSSILAM